MRYLSTALRCSALAGLFGIGIAASSSALAQHVYTRCDLDGDRCVRVVCDNDGDRCQRVNYYDRNSWNRSYQYRSGYHWRDGNHAWWGDRDQHDRRWVCDRDGDRCHWKNW